MTMGDGLTEAIIIKLEDEIDASGGMASLADTEGTMSLEDYLESRREISHLCYNAAKHIGKKHGITSGQIRRKK